MRLIYADTLKEKFTSKWILDRIDQHPTADVVEVKHAIWMPIQRGDEGYSAGDFICSCCGKPNHCYKVTDYCCSCGARMKGKEDD